MKKLLKVLALVAVMFATVNVARAERVDTPIDKMPENVKTQIQAFLNDYYPGVAVKSSWAKMMRPTTEPMWWRVNLENGTKLQFSLDGNWTNINAKKATTPVSIDVLPNEARKYISQNYANQTIKSVNFKKDQYKVTLSNGDKLTFDKTYQFKVKKHKDKKK